MRASLTDDNAAYVNSDKQNVQIIFEQCLRVCFKMQEDAISSGFACILRRFSAGLLAASQGKSTQKCRQRRRNCASGIFETHSSYANFGRHYLEVWTTVYA